MPMLGLMQEWSLTTGRILDHAARWHGKADVIDRRADGSILRRSYQDIHRNACRLSNALIDRRVSPGDRIATLAMNGIEHVEAWYGITGIGAVCHTLNPRLFPDQIIYIVNHAQDRMIIADSVFQPLLSEILPHCQTVEHVILIGGGDATGACGSIPVIGFDELLSAGHEGCVWGQFDENTAAGLCYTSGTTGDPKGVLYSHRSNFLHTMMMVQPDAFNLGARDTVLAVVPMYHANAWGLTFACPAVGARLVLPGARLDPISLLELIESEGVTVTAGVPTVWLQLVEYLEQTGRRPHSLQRIIVGGAPMPESLMQRILGLDIEPIHAWGMTEMSPIGGVNSMTRDVHRMSADKQAPWRLKQGRAPWGVDMKLVGAGGQRIAHDGVTPGNLRVRGPAVAAAYYGREGTILDNEGFFDTGDIAVIDDQGFMRITDRAKDIIKSGGEWISSIDIENAVLTCAKVAIAGVIGIPHRKWGERPRLYVQLKAYETATAAEISSFLQPLIPANSTSWR